MNRRQFAGLFTAAFASLGVGSAKAESVGPSVPMTELESINDALQKSGQRNDDMEIRLQSLRELVDVQCSSGNRDCDPYMHGMANGMILAQSVVDDEITGEPDFKQAPDKWLSHKVSTSDAVDALKQAIHNDDGLAWSYHCNIAMAAQDEGVSHEAAQNIARRFMGVWVERSDYPDLNVANRT